MRVLDLATLPIRAGVLLLLMGMAYYYGYGTPSEEWRKESPETGIAVRYTRNGRPWRTLYDRDRNCKWDMWIDERAGRPYIVSIDDDGDGTPDREEDEHGNPLSLQRSAELRAHKTLVEFLHNRRQWVYCSLALLLYVALELAVRLLAQR
jgi:hypothetical protein